MNHIMAQYGNIIAADNDQKEIPLRTIGNVTAN